MNLPIIVVILAIVYIILSVKLIFFKHPVEKNVLLVIVITELLIIASFSIPWIWLSMYFAIINFLLVLSGFILIFIKLFKKIPRNPLKASVNAVFILVMAIILFFSIIIDLYYDIKTACQTNIAFPLRHGKYTIIQGGSCPSGNLTHFFSSGSKYGLDIVKFSWWGTMCEFDIPLKSENFLIYGDSVFSPCSGIITKVVYHVPDHPPFILDNDNSAGNYVIIREDSLKICLSHLKQYSIEVEYGQKVEKGDFIGLVGNSGRSLIPHLHIHAVWGGDSNTLLQGTPVVISFNQQPVKINNIILRRKNFTIILREFFVYGLFSKTI